MPRTARLKQHEGRTLPDLAKPDPKPDSNGPDDDEILFSSGQHKKMHQAIDDARAVLKKFRSHLKLRGFNLTMMDRAMKDAEREDEATLSNMRDLQRYGKALRVPVHFQYSLFEEPLAANSNDALMTRAFTDGRERGIKGEFPDDQKWPPLTPEGQEHQRGWSEGQAVNLAKLKSLDEALAEQDKLAAAKAAKKAKKDAED